MTLSDEEAKVFSRLSDRNDAAYNRAARVGPSGLLHAQNQILIVLAEEVAKLRSAFEKVTSGGSIVVTGP